MTYGSDENAVLAPAVTNSAYFDGIADFCAGAWMKGSYQYFFKFFGSIRARLTVCFYHRGTCHIETN